MNLVRRFSLILAAFLAALAVVLAAVVERTYDGRILDELARDVGEHVAAESPSLLGNYDPSAPGSRARFRLFLDRLRASSNLAPILSVSLLSPSGRVLFSDDPSRVGRVYGGDPEFRAALAGRITMELTSPEREPLLLAGAGQVAEMYAPLPSSGGGAPGAVALLYLDSGAVHRGVAAARFQLWAVLLLGFGSLFAGVVWVVRRENLLLREKQEALDRSRAELAARRLELIDRIGAFALEGGGVQSVLDKSSRDVVDLLGVECCVIRSYGSPDLVGLHALPGFPPCPFGAGTARPPWCAAAWDGARPVVAEDAAAWLRERLPEEEYAVYGIGSFVAVPVSDGKAVEGVLFVARGGRHPWAPEEVHALEAVAGQVAVALRQALLLQAQQEMARRLLTLMNNVPGAPYQGRPDWTVSFIGADILAITGYSAEEFTEGGLRWRDLVHPDDLSRVRELFRGAVADRKERVRAEYRIVRKDGGVVWVADRRVLSYDAQGAFDHVDGLVLDITERKRSEERLRLTQFSVDRSPDGVCWIDREGRFLYANDAYCSLLGYSREELLSLRLQDVDPSVTERSWEEAMEEMRRGGVRAVASSQRAKDGTPVHADVTANLLVVDGREVSCATVRDARPRLQAEAEQRLLQAQLLQAQKMEALGLLAGGVAHDFNNLLQGILGYASILREKPLTMEEVARAAEVVQESAERAARLTGQLLGFARKGKNRVVPLDLNRLVRGVTDILERTLNPRIRILVDFSSEPAGTLGDPSQVEQVVMNLAMNACDAMPEGGDLSIRTGHAVLGDDFCRTHPGARQGRYSVVTVSDTGTGIPKELLERIFDPFFTTKEQGKGTGLGLSMVFGIVKNHGGYIDVESSEGEGTSFTVHLPWARPSEGEMKGPHPAFRSGGRKRGTVLVVDDQDAVREVCAAMLSGAGYDVLAAPGGSEGEALFRERSREIDLVILDMVMPGMSGRECFRRLREIRPDVRAVLSTGYSLEGEVQETMEEGIVAFLQKPYRMGQLVELVDRLLLEGEEAQGGKG